MRLAATLMASAFVMAAPAIAQVAPEVDPAPGVTAPGATDPGVVLPDTTAPPATAPDVAAPGTEPPMTAPDVAAPGTAPPATEPPATAPDVAAPAPPATAPGVPPTDPGVPAGMTAVTTADLNLRGGPGMEYPPMGVIPQGTQVQIETCLAGQVWCQITVAGTSGYASQRFLAGADAAAVAPPPDPGVAPPVAADPVPQPDPGAAPPPVAAEAPPADPMDPVTQGLQPVQATAQTTAPLNLRSGPGTEHPAIAVIPEGAAVEVIACTPDGQWCHVSFEGTAGFASGGFLSS